MVYAQAQAHGPHDPCVVHIYCVHCTCVCMCFGSFICCCFDRFNIYVVFCITIRNCYRNIHRVQTIYLLFSIRFSSESVGSSHINFHSEPKRKNAARIEKDTRCFHLIQRAARFLFCCIISAFNPSEARYCEMCACQNHFSRILNEHKYQIRHNHIYDVIIYGFWWSRLSKYAIDCNTVGIWWKTKKNYLVAGAFYQCIIAGTVIIPLQMIWKIRRFVCWQI